MAWYDILQGLGQGLQQAGQIAGTQRAQRQKLAQEQYSTLSPDVDLTADDVRQLTAEGGIPPSAFVKTAQGTFRRAQTLQEQVAAENLRKSTEEREADAASRTHIRNLIDTGQIPADIGEALLASPNAASAYVSYKAAIGKPLTQKTIGEVLNDPIQQQALLDLNIDFSRASNSLTPEERKRVSEKITEIRKSLPSAQNIFSAMEYRQNVLGPYTTARTKEIVDRTAAVDNAREVDPENPELQIIVNTLNTRLPTANKATRTLESVSSTWKNDTEKAKELARGAIIAPGNGVLTAKQNDDYTRRIAVIDATDRIRGILNELERDANAPKPGLFNGTLQAYAEKLGTLGNEKYSNYASQLKNLYTQGRQALTGAAFTKVENEEYQSFYPSATQSGNLARVRLDSLASYATAQNESLIRAEIGSAAAEAFGFSGRRPQGQQGGQTPTNMPATSSVLNPQAVAAAQAKAAKAAAKK